MPVTVVAEVEAGAAEPVRTENSSRSRKTPDAGTTSSSSVAMEWSGGGRLDAEATANTSTTQSTTDNVTSNLDRSPNRATIESGAGAGASGNIGINMAAGAGNTQSNQLSMVESSGNVGISIAAGVGNAQANAMSVSVVR